MSLTETITVELGSQSYPIYIGASLLNNPAFLENHLVSKQVLIVTNEKVASLYLHELLAQFSSSLNVKSVVLKDGEEFKTTSELNKIYDALLKNKFNRQATLIALGGGVIGDMTGYAAACYQRGVNFIQVPTTLLAQVDSSVGGKTGVNHPLGKNMIGAFYQPKCVLIDTLMLSTLPDKELRAGLAEVIKYGAICDSVFFRWLEQNMGRLLARDADVLAYAIKISCKKKAEVVSKDEKENGIRTILNFGHTFGHAIEAYMGYGKWLHGEAVAVGMCMAADLSSTLGFITKQDSSRLRLLCEKAKLPVTKPHEMCGEDFLKYMRVDKKNVSETIRLVLLKSLGEATIYNCDDETQISKTVESS